MWRCGAMALFVSLSVCSFAQVRPCTKVEAQHADDAIDTLNSWAVFIGGIELIAHVTTARRQRGYMKLWLAIWRIVGECCPGWLSSRETTADLNGLFSSMWITR